MEKRLFRTRLVARVRKRSAHVVVLGLGAVGIQVALAFAEGGFISTGVDTDNKRLRQINTGNLTGLEPILNRRVKKCVKTGRLRVTGNAILDPDQSDFLVLCLPTPLSHNDRPDLGFLKDACQRLSQKDRRGKCVILESSVYPGVTRNFIKPILETGGHVAGLDFGLVHSPERIDLNNARFPMQNIPKLVGGIDKASTEVAAALYEATLKAPIIRVESPEIAESAKMLENTYRFVNISLINELAELFGSLGIDCFAVVKAASTKPFGFMPHYPGPGIGGHCIPKDSFYMIHAGRKVGKKLSIVEAATAVNRATPLLIVSRIEESLTTVGKNIQRARIALLGFAYKANVSDWRRSPAIPIIDELRRRGATVKVYDPLVSETDRIGISLKPTLKETVQHADVVALVTDHHIFKKIDLAVIREYVSKNPVLFDSRNFWNRNVAMRLGYMYLGVGKPCKLSDEVRIGGQTDRIRSTQ